MQSRKLQEGLNDLRRLSGLTEQALPAQTTFASLSNQRDTNNCAWIEANEEGTEEDSGSLHAWLQANNEMLSKLPIVEVRRVPFSDKAALMQALVDISQDKFYEQYLQALVELVSRFQVAADAVVTIVFGDADWGEIEYDEAGEEYTSVLLAFTS